MGGRWVPGLFFSSQVFSLGSNYVSPQIYLPSAVILFVKTGCKLADGFLEEEKMLLFTKEWDWISSRLSVATIE